jgi:hypothetical protein
MKIIMMVALILLATSSLSAHRAHAGQLGQSCGGPGGVTCDKGLWCEPAAGMCASTAGVCVAIPRLCFARKRSKDYRPVCGCNSKTYSSDCFRRAYKVAKSHEGKCG